MSNITLDEEQDLLKKINSRKAYLKQFKSTQLAFNSDDQANFKRAVKALGEGKLEYVKFDDPRNYKVNFDKIQKELSYQYQFSLEDGIRELYEKIQLGEY